MAMTVGVTSVNTDKIMGKDKHDEEVASPVDSGNESAPSPSYLLNDDCRQGEIETEIPPSPSASLTEPGKMFVGGLSHSTTEGTLKAYFEKFGAIKETTIMRDPSNARSRGFGFVTFEDSSAVERVLENRPHMVDSKEIDPKMAVPRSSSHSSKAPTKSRKVFVGGVADTTTKEQIASYFSQFGKLEVYSLMMDRETNRHRGFGFVTFESADAAEKVCSIRYHTIDNKRIEAKHALPKEMIGGRNGTHRQQNSMFKSNGLALYPNQYQIGSYNLPSPTAAAPATAITPQASAYTYLPGYFIQASDFPYNSNFYAPQYWNNFAANVLQN
ncbi:hypothetical protein Aperf_G00000099503 [Anoplocephala perfoliata]